MLTKIWIKHFKNIDEILVDLTNHHKNLFIYGDNNQGKTNFLEAIYYLGNGQTPKSSKAVIQEGKQVLYLAAEVKVDQGTSKIYVKQLDDGKKSTQINKDPVKSFSKIKKMIPIGYLSADILTLFQGYPDGRRKELDLFLSNQDQCFKNNYSEYQKIIRQKTKALKENSELSFMWNPKIIELSQKIVTDRINALKKIESQLKILLKQMDSLSVEEVSCTYLPKGLEVTDMTGENYKKKLAEKLDLSQEKEKWVGMALYGPHRDDFEIKINGKVLQTQYSRGINRLVSIMFKVAQLKIMSIQNDEKTVLLLDDTFSEIDDKIKKNMFMVIENQVQLIYTTTRKDDVAFITNPLAFQMVDGQLNEVKV